MAINHWLFISPPENFMQNCKICVADCLVWLLPGMKACISEIKWILLLSPGDLTTAKGRHLFCCQVMTDGKTPICSDYLGHLWNIHLVSRTCISVSSSVFGAMVSMGAMVSVGQWDRSVGQWCRWGNGVGGAVGSVRCSVTQPHRLNERLRWNVMAQELTDTATHWDHKSL